MPDSRLLPPPPRHMVHLSPGPPCEATSLLAPPRAHGPWWVCGPTHVPGCGQVLSSSSSTSSYCCSSLPATTLVAVERLVWRLAAGSLLPTLAWTWCSSHMGPNSPQQGGRVGSSDDEQQEHAERPGAGCEISIAVVLVRPSYTDEPCGSPRHHRDPKRVVSARQCCQCASRP